MTNKFWRLIHTKHNIFNIIRDLLIFNTNKLWNFSAFLLTSDVLYILTLYFVFSKQLWVYERNKNLPGFYTKQIPNQKFSHTTHLENYYLHTKKCQMKNELLGAYIVGRWLFVLICIIRRSVSANLELWMRTMQKFV